MSAAVRTLGTGVPLSTGASEQPPGAVPDVEYFHPLLCLDNAINHPIGMRFATEEQVSQCRILSRTGAGRACPRNLQQVFRSQRGKPGGFVSFENLTNALDESPT